MSKKVIRHQISDVQSAIYETNPIPKGNWRKYWTMHLLLQANKTGELHLKEFTLPRGFTKRLKHMATSVTA